MTCSCPPPRQVATDAARTQPSHANVFEHTAKTSLEAKSLTTRAKDKAQGRAAKLHGVSHPAHAPCSLLRWGRLMQTRHTSHNIRAMPTNAAYLLPDHAGQISMRRRTTKQAQQALLPSEAAGQRPHETLKPFFMDHMVGSRHNEPTETNRILFRNQKPILLCTSSSPHRPPASRHFLSA